MKSKKAPLFFFSLLLLATPLVNAASCLTSSDEFATEVVIPNGQYEPSSVASLGGKQGQYYVANAEYGSGLLALFQKTSYPEGLAVRVQVPTAVQESKKPYLKLLSSSSTGTVRATLGQDYNGWSIECTSNACRFEKNFIALTAYRDETHEVSIEFSQRLDKCSSACTGICLDIVQDSRCLDGNAIRDIEAVARYANMSNTASELFTTYRVTSTQDIGVNDIVPTSSLAVDWKEALKQELVGLVAKGVITLPVSDIEAIGALAAKGHAGRDYRIIFDSMMQNWKYYYQTSGSVLTSERDCTIYTAPTTGNGGSVSNSFYLVPLIIAVAGILLLALLIIIGNILKKSKKKKGSR